MSSWPRRRCSWPVGARSAYGLAENSTAGYDATDKKGRRYEIKARRRTATSKPTHTSAIRNMRRHHFDFLLVVLFDETFSVEKAALLPYSAARSLARFRKHEDRNVRGVGSVPQSCWKSSTGDEMKGRYSSGEPSQPSTLRTATCFCLAAALVTNVFPGQPGPARRNGGHSAARVRLLS